MRQAWLIMAHNEFNVLQRLVSALDAPESAIFIHFDKKLSVLPDIRVEQGSLLILEKREDVRWGTVSQLEVELLLLEIARQAGPFGHYHILSGVHLPLKPLDELIHFYEEHPDEEIMRFWPIDEGDADFKLRRFHFPVKDFKSPVPWRRALCQRTWTAVIKVQKILGIRHLKDQAFRKTDQWLSLTEAACAYLVDNKKEILKKYRWAFCPDEYFIASELSHYPERFRMHDCPNLLYVRFDRESPISFPLEDLPRLQQTGYWWARKFTNGHAN